MRVSFVSVFEMNQGMITPKMPVRIGGMVLSPGIWMSVQGVTISGVSLSVILGRDLEVAQEAGMMVINGHY